MSGVPTGPRGTAQVKRFFPGDDDDDELVPGNAARKKNGWVMDVERKDGREEPRTGQPGAWGRTEQRERQGYQPHADRTVPPPRQDVDRTVPPPRQDVGRSVPPPRQDVDRSVPPPRQDVDRFVPSTRVEHQPGPPPPRQDAYPSARAAYPPSRAEQQHQAPPRPAEHTRERPPISAPSKPAAIAIAPPAPAQTPTPLAVPATPFVPPAPPARAPTPPVVVPARAATPPSVAPPAGPPGEIYERLVQVGEGTYGKVYKARNVETGELVALKRIRMEAEKDGFPVTAVREIKLLQSLRHPNVVDLREMMVSKGALFRSPVPLRREGPGTDSFEAPRSRIHGL